jgi:hypothetical protein
MTWASSKKLGIQYEIEGDEEDGDRSDGAMLSPSYNALIFLNRTTRCISCGRTRIQFGSMCSVTRDDESDQRLRLPACCRVSRRRVAPAKKNELSVFKMTQLLILTSAGVCDASIAKSAYTDVAG